MSPAAPTLRYDHIDALRAIAALLVVWIHVAETLVEVASSGVWVFSIAREISVGGVGVTVFFLISGFVIPSSLNEAGPRCEELRVFAVRRFFRLYPAFWFSIPFAVVAVWWAFWRATPPEMIVANLTMVARPLGFPLLESPYWTLFIELVFYAICAGLFALGLLRHASILLGMSVLFAAMHMVGYVPGVKQGWNVVLYEDQLAVQLSIMFLGALLRRWHAGSLSEPARFGTVGMLTLWLMFPFAAGLYFVDGRPALVYSDVEGSKAIGIALFLVFAFVLKPRFRPLVALGRASYSLYLFHMIVASALLWLALQPGLEWLRGWDLGLYLALGAALSIAVAVAVYAFVERPALSFGHRLSRPPTKTDGLARPSRYA